MGTNADMSRIVSEFTSPLKKRQTDSKLILIKFYFSQNLKKTPPFVL